MLNAIASQFRAWTLVNEDTFEVLKGQFEAEEVTEDLGAAYAERFTLNRQRAILQYVHGVTPTISFRGRFFNQTITGGALPIFHGRVEGRLENLKSWVEQNPTVNRPPTVVFWIGDGHLQQRSVIESISGIRYDPPGAFGTFRGATFTVNLRRYDSYNINSTSNFDTRYHVAAEGDYYELLAWREYKNADLGVWLRQQNPTQSNLTEGNIVPLPSPGAQSLRTARIRQDSVVFKTAFSRQSTPQRERRLSMLEARSKAQVSHVVITGSGLGG